MLTLISMILTFDERDFLRLYTIINSESYIQGGPKKRGQIIFAITLCTASQFP